MRPIATKAGSETVWNELNRTDLQRVKQDIETRRSEMLARHAEELADLDADQAELTVIDEAIDAVVRKFNLGHSTEIVPLERGALSRVS
jgi:hypothetical protein